MTTTVPTPGDPLANRVADLVHMATSVLITIGVLAVRGRANDDDTRNLVSEAVLASWAASALLMLTVDIAWPRRKLLGWFVVGWALIGHPWVWSGKLMPVQALYSLAVGCGIAAAAACVAHVSAYGVRSSGQPMTRHERRVVIYVWCGLIALQEFSQPLVCLGNIFSIRDDRVRAIIDQIDLQVRRERR